MRPTPRTSASARAPSSPWRMRSSPGSATSRRRRDVGAALDAYHAERNLEALKLQSAARNRMEWFENVARYTHLTRSNSPTACLPRSQRIGHENLQLRDPRVRGAPTSTGCAALRRSSRAAAAHVPAAALGLDGACEPRGGLAHGAVLARTRVCRATGTWCTTARARVGGAGLVFTEMTCAGARCAHHARLHGAVERGAARGLAAHRRFRAPRTHPRRSRCSSGTPAARARPSSAGRPSIIRCRRATGRLRVALGNCPILPA